MTRQEANIIIAQEILNACTNSENSDFKFGQLLVDMGVLEYSYNERTGFKDHLKDPYNEESVLTLKRML